MAHGAGADSNSIYDRNSAALDGRLTTEDGPGFRNGSFVVAPIPFSNPTIGSGLILGAGYLFKTDEGSKPSVLGAGALRSDNGSQAYALSVNLAFRENKWLFKSFIAQADIRYELFTPVGTLPIRQDGVLGQLSLSYGVTRDLSFGGKARYLDTTITPDVPGLPPIPPPFSKFLDVEIASLGLVTDWDKRDDAIYPTSGLNLHIEALQNVALSGLVENYQKAFVNFTKYFPLGDRTVLAGRVSTCAASSETPFFDQCSLGATDNFRGFSAAQFLDLRSASIQLEVRQQVSSRIRVVAFGGVGMVGPHYQDLDIGGTHAAGGVGGRYRISKKFPLDFSVDIARNDQQENTLYIYVGQRF